MLDCMGILYRRFQAKIIGRHLASPGGRSFKITTLVSLSLSTPGRLRRATMKQRRALRVEGEEARNHAPSVRPRCAGSPHFSMDSRPLVLALPFTSLSLIISSSSPIIRVTTKPYMSLSYAEAAEMWTVVRRCCQWHACRNNQCDWSERPELGISRLRLLHPVKLTEYAWAVIRRQVSPRSTHPIAGRLFIQDSVLDWTARAGQHLDANSFGS